MGEEKEKNSNNIDSMVKIIMNPVRLRIVQYLIVHGTGTVSQIKEELNDIPPASLYRHIKTLHSAGYIIVTEEKKIRGTVEKTYVLNPTPMKEPTKEDAEHLIHGMLLSLMASFTKYFAKEDADPVKDMLSMSTSVMFLTDEELVELLTKIGEVFSPHINNKNTEGRKARRITFISSPNEKE